MGETGQTRIWDKRSRDWNQLCEKNESRPGDQQGEERPEVEGWGRSLKLEGYW